MRAFLLVIIAVLAGCSSTEWPEAGKNPSGYGAVSAADLIVLRPGDTAADVFKKMGSVVGDIPLPWFDYFAADHEGKFYRFQFDHGKRRNLRPRDRLVSVELVSPESAVGVVVWPLQKKAEGDQVSHSERP